MLAFFNASGLGFARAMSSDGSVVPPLIAADRAGAVAPPGINGQRDSADPTVLFERPYRWAAEDWGGPSALILFVGRGPGALP